MASQARIRPRDTLSAGEQSLLSEYSTGALNRTSLHATPCVTVGQMQGRSREPGLGLRLPGAAPSPRAGRTAGELLTLGIRPAPSTLAKILSRAGLGPAPRRGATWRAFLKTQATGVVATDSSPWTPLLRRLYVLFFIELGRRVWITGITDHLNGPWVTQQSEKRDHGSGR